MCPFRQEKGGQRTIPGSTDLKLASVQNNSYAKVAYFKMAYFAPFSCLRILGQALQSLLNNRASKNLKGVVVQKLHGGLRRRRLMSDLWVVLANGMDFYKFKRKKSTEILKELYHLKLKGTEIVQNEISLWIPKLF